MHEAREIVVHTDVVGQDFNLTSYIVDAGGGYTFWQARACMRGGQEEKNIDVAGQVVASSRTPMTT